ncbi:MAG: heptosyltransferase [Fimbriimonadaceae bacterium]|nr:heptosyltransferase [Fimbriimonadaceae bacterium]
MRRYAGEGLPVGCRIAVVANDALGNYVVSTPLLQMLRERWNPSVLHYYSGTRTEELWAEDPKIDWGFCLHGNEPHFTVLNAFVETGSQPYDLVINLENTAWPKSFTAVVAALNTYVCGPCTGADGRGDLPFEQDPRGKLWADKDWISANLPLKYSFLQTGFIGEIFCRLAYLDGPIPPYDLPSHDVTIEIPDVIISTAASLTEKLWPIEKWAEIIQRLKTQNVTVGLVGAKPTAQSRFWKGAVEEDQLVERRLVKDLRGAFSLPSVVGVLAKAKTVLTIDNGILHLAVAANAPTVGLYRYGIHRLWAPPYPNLEVLTPEEDQPVSEISVDTVWEALQRAL